MSISSRLVRMSRNHNIERLADKKHYEESGMNKLPEITIYFWIMKICATTLGETGGDLLSMTLNVGYATSSLILIGFFLIALECKLLSKQFHQFLYWTEFLSPGTAGTPRSV